MKECPDCGKRYPAEERGCPDCSKSGTDAQVNEIFGSSQEATMDDVPVAADNIDEKGIAKWLMGEKEDFSKIGTEENTKASEETTGEPQSEPAEESGIIEDWLKGNVNDISSWLSGETAAKPAFEEGAPTAASDEVREAAERASEGMKKLLEEFRAGKVGAEEIAKEAFTLLSELQAVKAENVKVKEELESVRKGSTALAKYFKGGPGVDDSEKLMNELAMEMAAREELEVENLKLHASIDALNERFEKGLEESPEEIQDFERMRVEIAEKDRIIKEMEGSLKTNIRERAAGGGEGLAELREKFSTELRDRILEFDKKESALTGEIEKLKLSNKDFEVNLRQKNEEMQVIYNKVDGGKINEGLKSRLLDLQRTERELALRNEEVAVLKGKVLAKEEEMTALKDPMKFKEDEMLRREEELLHREKLMEEQLKRFEQMKAELGGQEEYDLKKRLEQLQAEVTAKEEAIKAKEKYISAKEEDLRLREQGVIGQEIDRKEEERALEFKIEKVKTGTGRLDDLLMGGLPFGTNVLIYGPPFMGKEVLVNNFVFEGLAKGIPTIWVVTDKTPAEIRDEMRYVRSGFEEYEKLGLVKFVDSYSRSMGDTSNDPNVIYVDTPTDFQGIQNGVEQAAKEVLEKHKYYRFVFRSISTMIAYLDPATAFRFLNPIAGRRKRDKAVSMYLIEKGMHGEQEIQMVGSLMDGMIEFKVENLNTFLCVKGIGDTQSRAWIRYTTTKSAVNIGSFALDHIR
jgi:KaiC/GvpD/RAD55 family RecA-like ATPase